MKPSIAFQVHRDAFCLIVEWHGASNARVFGSVAQGCDMNYEPHMTFCYDSHNRAQPTHIDPIELHIAEFALIKSHIGLSRHEVLRTWPLSG